MADPWVAVEATIRRSQKLTSLPNDSARWGFVVALGECKLLNRGGSMTPAQWSELMGRHARFLADYVAVGLVHRMPEWCGRPACMRGRGPFPDGTLVIHHWPTYQREHARRQAELEKRHADAQTDATTDVVTDATTDTHSRGRTGAVPVPVYVSGHDPRPGEPYQVADDGPEGPVLSWLAAQGIGIAPDGGGFHRKLVMLVERYGADGARAALSKAIASGARGARAVVFGAENLLDPVPSANVAVPKPRKGYMARQEDLDALAR